jgi:hypothetical protein
LKGTPELRSLILSSLILLAAVTMFGHAGEVHKYMGTVDALHDDGSFMLKKSDGTTMHVAVSAATAYQRANGETARRAELVTGSRVVVTIGTDGKTATRVRFSNKKSG